MPVIRDMQKKYFEDSEGLVSLGLGPLKVAGPPVSLLDTLAKGGCAF